MIADEIGAVQDGANNSHLLELLDGDGKICADCVKCARWAHVVHLQ
jgi:hypothetical protein